MRSSFADEHTGLGPTGAIQWLKMDPLIEKEFQKLITRLESPQGQNAVPSFDSIEKLVNQLRNQLSLSTQSTEHWSLDLTSDKRMTDNRDQTAKDNGDVDYTLHLQMAQNRSLDLGENGIAFNDKDNHWTVFIKPKIEDKLVKVGVTF
jgi:hypothetical protein